MKNWRCKILGHHWNPEGAEYYCVYDCMRCGHSGYESGSWRERASHQWWRIGQRVQPVIRRMRNWLKCSECGGRFGRCDYENFDHLPF